MSDDLDLRTVHRRHEPDPRFVTELGDRIEAIISSSTSGAGSTDEGVDVTIELEAGDAQSPSSRHHRRRKLGAAIILVAAGVATFALVASTGHAPRDEVTALRGKLETNGWIAFADGGDIHLIRPGGKARELSVAGSDLADDSCPTWSPDGARLSFGRLTGPSDAPSRTAELVIVSVDRDGAVGTPTVIPLDDFRPLPGFDPHPCATWAPDGRWVAFVGSGAVWVTDTHTGAIRRLPELRPTDLEWRPGTDELTIAGDIGPDRGAQTSSTPVSVYSVSTGELRQLGSVRAANITWSPDGSTLAYQGGENDPGELWLVDADGADERLLTLVGAASHGVGPVWSPTGERIVYQRLLDGERHEVVLVSVPDGTETVIDPPETAGADGPESWYPSSVTWSPDGTTLLYSAWSHRSGGTAGGTPSGALAVDPDDPSNVMVITDRSGLTGLVYDHSWVPLQMWGRLPGTTIEAPEIRAFAVPFRFDGPFDDWISIDGQIPFLDFDVGPVDGLPRTSIKFAIPRAATPGDAVADIVAKAPSLFVLGDPVDTSVGNMLATCMDVALADGQPGAPLFTVYDGSVAYPVEVQRGTEGRVCVVDVEGRPVIVFVRAPTADFAAFLDQAQSVLDTVEFCTDCPPPGDLGTG